MKSGRTEKVTSNQAFLRMLWKEYRQQRGLFLSILLGTILLQLVHLTLSPAHQSSSDYPFAVASIMTIVYTVAMACLLFAAEKEERTVEFLQQLPVKTWRIAWPKFLFSFCSISAMGLLLTLSAFLITLGTNPQSLSSHTVNQFSLSGHTFYKDAHQNVLLTTITYIILSFTCSTICSLISRKVIASLIASTTLILLLGSTISIKLPVQYRLTAVLIVAALLSVVITFLLHGWRYGRTHWLNYQATPAKKASSQWRSTLVERVSQFPAMGHSPLGTRLVASTVIFFLIAIIALSILVVLGPRSNESWEFTSAVFFFIPIAVVAIVITAQTLVIRNLWLLIALNLLTVFLVIPGMMWGYLARNQLMLIIYSITLGLWWITSARESAHDTNDATVRPALRLRGLKKVAQSRSPFVRSFSVILWQEMLAACQFLQKYLASILALYIAISAFPFLFRTAPLGRSNFLHGAEAWKFYLLLTPFLCGVLAFNRDRQNSGNQFLVNHGVSAALSWGVKQLVWLVTAVICLVTILLAIYANYYVPQNIISPHSGSPPASLISVLHDSLLINSAPSKAGLELIKKPDLDLVVPVTFLTLFSWGQLCVMLFRRNAIMLTLGGLGNVVFLIWQSWLVTFGVPLMASTLPLMLAGFTGTYFMMRSWMREESSWKIVLSQVLWGTVPLLITVFLVLTSRVVQIPDSPPPEGWQAAVSRHENYDETWSAKWREPTVLARMTMSDGTITNKSVELVEQLNALAEEIRNHPHRRIDPLIVSDFTSRHMTFYRMSTQLSATAQRQIQQGDLEAAWKTLSNGIEILVYLHSQAGADSYDLTQAVRGSSLYPRLVVWAQHENQTPELLDQARQFLQQKTETVSSSAFRHDKIMNEYADLRLMSSGRSRVGRAYEEEAGIKRTSLTDLFSGIEGIRHIRLLNLATSLSNKDHGRIPAKTDYLLDEKIKLHGLEERYRNYSQNLGQSSEQLMTIMETLWIAVEIENHRLAQGSYPEALHDLSPEVLQKLPNNIYSKFEYRSAGWPLPVLISGTIAFQGGQPLLIAKGREAYDVTYVDPRNTMLMSRPEAGQQQLQGFSEELTRIFPQGFYWANKRPDGNSVRNFILHPVSFYQSTPIPAVITRKDQIYRIANSYYYYDGTDAPQQDFIQSKFPLKDGEHLRCWIQGNPLFGSAWDLPGF